MTDAPPAAASEAATDTGSRRWVSLAGTCTATGVLALVATAVDASLWPRRTPAEAASVHPSDDTP
ncbi:MAG: hypothetical protein ACTHN0_18855 [Aquihabitans sp.]